MADVLRILVAFWIGLGGGIAFTAWLMITAEPDVTIEHSVKSPQKMLAEWL